MLFSLWPCRKWFIHFVQRGDLKRGEKKKNKLPLREIQKKRITIFKGIVITSKRARFLIKIICNKIAIKRNKKEEYQRNYTF